MKVLVAGSTGQLAQALAEAASVARIELRAYGRPNLDLESRAGAEQIAALAPEVIINAAAYTAVDAAESDAARAFAVNRDGAAWLAGIAAARGIPFIHVSTDYVFDGAKSSAYVEHDATGPLGVYGRSKREGEQAVLHVCPHALIVRTAWVYSAYGSNFVKTMLRLAREREALRVVDDQIGNPTSAHDIAAALLAIARTMLSGTASDACGIFHLAARGETTWCGFARAIMRLADEAGHRSVPVVPITTAEYPTPARRPANSRLDCGKLQATFGIALPDWRESLPGVVRRLVADASGKARGAGS
jgi:dTDP-4-dehydrorhamnose reductase